MTLFFQIVWYNNRSNPKVATVETLLFKTGKLNPFRGVRGLTPEEFSKDS
ncbi:hypothetical protein [Kamptonema formosum]|nr:hypothetical protein [Oscillatoria sp. PCC 10802]